MHMVSRKDLNSAELETVRVSKSPTTVVTANGEVLAKEEATENVRELDLFVRCARGDAWRLAKNILKLKEADNATFFSPTNEWCFPAPSATKLEEREFCRFRREHAHVEQRNTELCRIGNRESL